MTIVSKNEWEVLQYTANKDICLQMTCHTYYLIVWLEQSAKTTLPQTNLNAHTNKLTHLYIFVDVKVNQYNCLLYKAI